MDLITITRGTLQDWVGRRLTDEEVERIFTALPHSSVPEAIATIAANLTPRQCEHPLEEFSLVEDGYQRSWYTEVDEDTKTIRASFGGSSDWSEEGTGGEYLQCGMCSSTRPVPDDYEIDWR